MYDTNYLRGVESIGSFLGLGRNTVLRLCQERPNSFPVVKVGRQYQADVGLLTQWKNDWYKGKFTI